MFRSSQLRKAPERWEKSPFGTIFPNQRSFPREEDLSDLLPTRPFRKRKRLRKAPLVSSNLSKNRSGRIKTHWKINK